MIHISIVKPDLQRTGRILTASKSRFSVQQRALVQHYRQQRCPPQQEENKGCSVHEYYEVSFAQPAEESALLDWYLDEFLDSDSLFVSFFISRTGPLILREFL